VPRFTVSLTIVCRLLVGNAQADTRRRPSRSAQGEELCGVGTWHEDVYEAQQRMRCNCNLTEWKRVRALESERNGQEYGNADDGPT